MEVRRGDGGVVAVEVVGAEQAIPVLFCHGLADSRLSARAVADVAHDLGLRLIAPDRPGIGGSDFHRLDRVVDWVGDATLVLDALGVDQVSLVGVSGGGAFAAACAAAMPGRARRLVLISALGPPAWSTRGMAGGQRLALQVARRAPAFGGWFLGRLAAVARRAPNGYLRLAMSEMPDADRRALARADVRDAFVANYVESFRRGRRGVGQDLRVLTRPWGFELGAIGVATHVHHGDVDTTVPLSHARGFASAIPGARLHVHAGHGHFSILDVYGETLASVRD